MPMPQELGDRAAHRVTRRGQLLDAEHVGEGGDIVGTIGEPEMPRADAMAMTTMVDGDHAVPLRQRLEAPQPVEPTGGGQTVQQHDRRRTWRTSRLTDECGAATRKFDEATGGND